MTSQHVVRGKKVCTKCREWKPANLEEFPAAHKTRTGFSSWCRACHRKADRERRKTLTPEQRKAERGEYELAPTREAACEVCGAGFIIRGRAAKSYCGAKCRNRAKSRRNPGARKRFQDRTRHDRNAKRRATKQAAASSEPVLLAKIRERDGGTCGICGAPVGEGARWPDPASASLDHIVPLIKGGAHDPANVQLAHLGCNIRKGARVSLASRSSAAA